MSTNKLLQSLSEDPQLEKQIGCMAGILQLFDRHQVLTGRRLYGHKRISAAAPKTQNASTSNCGSPASETSGTSGDLLVSSHVRLPSDYEKQKQPTSTGIIASSEQQKNQPLPTVTSLSPSDVKSSSAYARAQCLGAVSDASLHASSGDHLPKISFEMARSSILTPRRLDSSRSLHEGRANVSHEAKVFARRSVDTAERAAAAARGALKELSRISADIGGPSHHTDQVSIRDIVRSSFAKEQQAPRSITSHSAPGLSATQHTAFAPRMSHEAGMGHPKPDREQHVDFAQCNPNSKPTHAANTQGAQASARMEGASRPPRHYKAKSDAPTKSCADMSESLKLLAKLREATPPYNGLLLKGNSNPDHGGIQAQSAANRLPRPPVTSTRDIAMEAPVAFSSRAPLPKAVDQIQGRMGSYEPSRSSSVDAFLHVGLKAKEIPRLSLDGRGSGAGIKVDCETGSLGKMQYSRSLLPSRSVSCSNSDCDTESLHEKRTSFSSNVVAKLMGLEEMPNEEVPEAAILQNKLDPYGSLDQKASKQANPTTQEANPTFSQCGKYVSASFFPSKRRDDISIVIDAEEEEEDSYLQMEPLTHQEARTLSVRVGTNLQAGVHRLTTTTEGASNIGHPCFQPKNHHLMEDRPPHVLSPAARLCAQIEELQRADSVYKTIDRGLRTMEMHSSEQDLEALKQLLGDIHLNKDSSHTGLYSEKLAMRATSEQQLGSGRVQFPQEQYAEQVFSSPVIWKTKRMLNDELYAHKTHQNSTYSRIPAEGLNKKVKNIIPDPGPLPSYRQHAPSEAYIPATRTRAESRSYAAESHLSACSTRRKTNNSNDCVTPISTANAQPANVSRRLVSRANVPSNIMSARFSTSPQTPPSQQSRQSYNSSYSWEGSSVSSTSSCHANSSYQAAGKKNRQLESQERKRTSTIIHKDKEESKANLASMKSSPITPVERRLTSGVGSRSTENARTVRRCTPLQNSDHARSSMRSPTKTSARKAEEVKRKLNFVNRSPGKVRASQVEREDLDTEFVDKTMVSSIDNSEALKDYAHLDQNRGNASRSKAGHDKGPSHPANSHRDELRETCCDVALMKTEVGFKSPPLLVPSDDMGDNLHNGHLQATASRFGRDHEEPIMQGMGSPVTLICIPAGPLKLPQVAQEENEDSESQEEKSTGSCEQPSPCSVLEGPFYEEEDVASPATATEFILKLEEMEEKTRDQGVDRDCEVASFSPQLSAPPRRPDIHNCSTVDFAYVTQFLDMATNSNDSHRSPDILTLRPLAPHSFLQLEEENLNSHGNAPTCKCEIGSMWRRRLLFDSVNASLERRLTRWRGCQRQPWLLACERDFKGIMGRDCSQALQQGMVGLDEEKNVCLSREGGRVLYEEVWEEMGEINRGLKGKRKRKSDSVGMGAYEEEERGEEDGTCDDVGRMLEEDMRGGPFHTRSPDSWATWRVEKGELGLDLERLIFKDLIDHTIRDLGLLVLPTTPRLLALSTTPRQLRKLHNN